MPSGMVTFDLLNMHDSASAATALSYPTRSTIAQEGFPDIKLASVQRKWAMDRVSLRQCRGTTKKVAQRYEEK